MDNKVTLAWIGVVALFLIGAFVMAGMEMQQDPPAALTAFKDSDVEWFVHLKDNVGLDSGDLYQCALELHEGGDSPRALWVIGVGIKAGYEMTPDLETLIETCVTD